MSQNINTLPAVVALALSKVASRRDEVAPGAYSGSAIIRVDYSGNVGADYVQSVSAATPWQRIALSAFSKLNTILGEVAAAEAMASIIADETPEEHRADLAERATAMYAALAESSTKKCKGKVTIKATARLATFGEQVAAAEESLAMAAAAVGA